MRDSLKSWGHSATLTPTLSSLLPQPFVVNYQSVFFYSRFNACDKNNAIARYLVKTVLYALWHFRNKATFHNGTEDHRALLDTSLMTSQPDYL